MTQNKNIIILGCGLSGMISSLAIAGDDTKVIIIESRSTFKPDFFEEARTTAITKSSKEFFEKIGIWNDLEKISGPINDIYVVDNKAPNILHFIDPGLEDDTVIPAIGEGIHETDNIWIPHQVRDDVEGVRDDVEASRDDVEASRDDLEAARDDLEAARDDLEASRDEAKKPMGYMLENSLFKKTLFDIVSSNKNISIIDKTTYDSIENHSESASLKLNNGKTLKADLIVICDGPNSPAKARFFSPEIIKSYQQSAMTFIVHHEKPHEGTAVEHFLPLGPFAILPLKSQYHSSIVWTVKEKIAPTILKLPKAELAHLVQENFGPFLGKVKLAQEPTLFRLRAYATRKYYNKRLVLAADSAHIIHPLAGQGLNQGIKDISALREIISHRPINDSSLREYETTRRRDNLQMLELTDIINSVFSNDSKLLHLVRQFGFKMINSFPPLRDKIVKYAIGRR